MKAHPNRVVIPVTASSALPESLASKSAALSRAYEDYCQRQETGNLTDPEAFCERYPNFKTSLRRLIEVHRFLDGRSFPDTGSVPIRWPEPGDSFLGFTFQRELGRGAFARVFLATEPALGGRLVAVKVSHQGAAEAETLGRLDHPNIVPVYSVQKEDLSGLSVVCMPYLGSATLCDVLDRAFAQPDRPARAQVILDAVRDTAQPGEPSADRSSPPPWLRKGRYVDAIVYLAAQLADALSFVHAKGICHRDLKPSNVLVTPQGTPMLLDFNLSFDKQKAEQRLGGTLPYMAPEHLRATDPAYSHEPEVVDERSDLFSFGVILYELLDGVHPFGPIPLNRSPRAVREQLLERQRRGAEPLRRVNPQVGSAVAQIIEHCLAYDPADRPRSATEVAIVLRRRLRRVEQMGRLRVGVLASLPLLLSVMIGAAVLHKQPITRGLEAYRQGQYEQAILSLDRALASDPHNVLALYTRGRAYLRLRQFGRAFTDFMTANQFTTDGRIKACIGYCLSRKAEHAEAISYYEQAIRTGFAAPEVLNDLGFSQVQSNRLLEAKDTLDRAIELDPSSQAAFHNRALVDLKTDRKPGFVPEQGRVDIETALRLGPPTAELFYHAACLYAVAAEHDRNLIDLALNHLRNALDQGYYPRLLKGDSSLLILRSDPRFQELTKRVAVPGSPERLSRLVDPIKDDSY
jgi:serine/threonine protein kinase